MLPPHERLCCSHKKKFNACFNRCFTTKNLSPPQCHNAQLAQSFFQANKRVTERRRRIRCECSPCFKQPQHGSLCNWNQTQKRIQNSNRCEAPQQPSFMITEDFKVSSEEKRSGDHSSLCRVCSCGMTSVNKSFPGSVFPCCPSGLISSHCLVALFWFSAHKQTK